VSAIPLLFLCYADLFPCSADLIPLFDRVAEFADTIKLFQLLAAAVGERESGFYRCFPGDT
jgi:hypothetical protein